LFQKSLIRIYVPAFLLSHQDHKRLAEKRVLGNYQKAGTSILKRVTGGIFTISKIFLKQQAGNVFCIFFTLVQKVLI
jgi:hypothetical protein